MRKPMKESAAWRKLAEWYGNNPTREFICNDLDGLSCGGPITTEMPRVDMLDRINGYVDCSESGCRDSKVLGGVTGLPLSSGTTLSVDDDNSARVLMCLLLAYEAEEEGK